MASINFLYRSTKKIAPLTVRLLFRHDGNDYTFGTKTNYLVSADNWREYQKKRKQSTDIDFQNFKTDTDAELQEIQKHILTTFFDSSPSSVNNDWMKDVVSRYYTPVLENQQAPTELIKFFSFYIDMKRNDLSDRRIQRIVGTQNKLRRFQTYKRKTYNLEDLNDFFKNDLIDYLDVMQYSNETQKSDFAIIKTVCSYAPRWDVAISPHLKDFKIQTEQSDFIYLNFKELEAIEAVDLTNDLKLDNARDFLLISCYTAQRISDFMRFSNDMLEVRKGKHLLTFMQQKGKKQEKRVTIPLLPPAKKILDKRNGAFPRRLSEQKYNEYIKIVCKLAGLTEPITGKKRVSIAPEGTKPKKTDFRNIEGTFEKWELVASHIGRRSFSTNYYGEVPTSVLIGITGHSTEKMFLRYIQKTESQSAIDAFKYFK